eukprot:13835236-Alexandrium_andersonii.AAC.1
MPAPRGASGTLGAPQHNGALRPHLPMSAEEPSGCLWRSSAEALQSPAEPSGALRNTQAP